jgi:hypothetical protein
MVMTFEVKKIESEVEELDLKTRMPGLQISKGMFFVLKTVPRERHVAEPIDRHMHAH